MAGIVGNQKLGTQDCRRCSNVLDNQTVTPESTG